MADQNGKWNPRSIRYDYSRPLPGRHVLSLFTGASVSGRLSLDKPIRVLEPGAGTGRILVPLACRYRNWSFTAVDSNENMLEFLRDRMVCEALDNIEVVKHKIEDHGPAEQPDLIIISSLLHLVPAWQELLDYLNGMLGRSGMIALIGDEADQYNLVLSRSGKELSGDPDSALATFWQSCLGAWDELNLPKPRNGQGCRWDLMNEEPAAWLRSNRWQEVPDARARIGWKQFWTLDQLFWIVKNRAYSQFFRLEDDQTEGLVELLAERLEPLPARFYSRHLAAVRFFERSSSAGAEAR